MSCKVYLIAFIIGITLSSCDIKKAYTEEMKLQLNKMYIEDQRAQIWDPKKEQRKSYRDSMEIAASTIFKQNLDIVKDYFNNYGFPGIKENGDKAALHFWTIIQHADHDVTFQNKVLKKLKKELKNKNVNPRNFAYLFDRVKKNQNKPQRYGTQIVWVNGKPQPYLLENPDMINELRRKMELEPIEDYLKKF